jgi:hypothetical protein
LYLQGVCTATVDGTAAQSLYARSDFKEFPRVTDALCTHKYYVYEEPIKVHECKELTSLGDCVQLGIYYDKDVEGLVGEACGVTDTTGVFGGHTGGNTTVYADGVIASDAACATECTNARDYCHWYTFDDSAGG